MSKKRSYKDFEEEHNSNKQEKKQSKSKRVPKKEEDLFDEALDQLAQELDKIDSPKEEEKQP